LRDPTFSRLGTIPTCDTQETHTQTDTQTHDDGYYPSRASSARVKMGWFGVVTGHSGAVSLETAQFDTLHRNSY